MDTITINKNNIGSFAGAVASRYSYTPALRSKLDDLFRAAQRSENRFFVLDANGNTLAAQHTRTSAEAYMQDGRVLVQVESCGNGTYMIGTNGGMFPCGSSVKGLDGVVTVERCAVCTDAER